MQEHTDQEHIDSEEIEVATIRTKYCRKTGEKISSEVISIEKRNKKEFYAPLVEVFASLYEKNN